MQIELQACYSFLKKWKENPEETDSIDKVKKAKEFLKKHNPSSYQKLFPEEENVEEVSGTIQYDEKEFEKIDNIVKSFLNKSESVNPPQFVIFTGGVGSGKTTSRKEKFPSGYVHFEFGEILNAVKYAFGEENPKLVNAASFVGSSILRECIKSKKNIVIEIIGDNKESLDAVMNKMKEVGYEIHLVNIFCDPAEAYERHLKAVKDDKDYLSAYFTQEATLSFFYQHFEFGNSSASSSE